MAKAEEKKPVLVRVPMPTYAALLKEAAELSVARGRQVSVPQLLVEYACESIDRRKGHK